MGYDISGLSKYNDGTGFSLRDPEYSSTWNKQERKTFGGGSGTPDWAKAADIAGRFLSAAGGGGRDKYRDRAESYSYRGPRILDRGRGGFGGELMEGFSIYEPQRDPIMFIPGDGSGAFPGGGGSPTTSTGQRLARAGGGALSGAATGASIGSVVPGLGTALGAGIGAIAGGLSSFFG
jgi:hypothetical protein